MTNKNKKDPNQIAYIEKAIAKKFGKEAIINPKSGWTDEKEEGIFRNVYTGEKMPQEMWKNFPPGNNKGFTARIFPKNGERY